MRPKDQLQCLIYSSRSFSFEAEEEKRQEREEQLEEHPGLPHCYGREISFLKNTRPAYVSYGRGGRKRIFTKLV